jgi:Tol biopolymer transport system component
VIGSPGDANIYLINADGSNRRRLTGAGNDQAEPDWSPDGQFVAYQSDRAGNYDVWVIDAGGGNERQLTTGDADEREPDWSPDGGQIVYRRGGEPNGDGELWVMDAGGQNQRQLGGQAISGRAPVWSPDGSQVAFMSERGDTWNVYLLDLSSGDVRRVSGCSAHCRFPSWSPDGQYILFHSTESANSFTPVKVWRQRADGSGSAELLAEGNNPGRAVWSAEGPVAFNTDDGIEIMNADGSERHALPNSDDGWAPDWSH